MLPKEIFDQRKSRTTDPKRKFASKEYLMDVNRNTRVIDLKTQKAFNLDNAVDKFGIIDMQLLDFVGSLFLDYIDWTIQTGFNRLFLKKLNDIEGVLLEHKLKLSRYIHSYRHQEAMTEFDQILKFEEAFKNKFTEFRYSCLKGRILMRQRKLDSAKAEFENAFSLLENEFTKEEKDKLISDRSYRYRFLLTDPNWDEALVDYDEIHLLYLYTTTLFLQGSFNDPPLMSIINQGLELAKSHNSNYDIVDFYQLRAEINIRLSKYNIAIEDLQAGLKIIEDTNDFENNFELQSDLVKSLINALLDMNKFDQAHSEILKYAEKFNLVEDVKKFNTFLLIQIDYYLQVEDMDRCFAILQNYVDHYQKHPDYQIFEPLGIAKYLFIYSIQGMYLQKLLTLEALTPVLEIFKSISKNSKQVEIYSELVLIEFHLLENRLINNKIDYETIKNRYLDLISKHDPSDWRYFIIISHFANFTANQIPETKLAFQDLLHLLEQYTLEIMNSPFVLLAIKLEITRMMMTKEKEKIEDWLTSISEFYPTMKVSKIVEFIKIKMTEKVQPHQFLIDLLQNELYFIRFENFHEIPVLIKLSKKN